jgi:dolichol-phosphate mannosyltransferase
MPGTMNDTLIVVPTYNEKDNVIEISQAVFRECSRADILFVDDNSPDGTGRILDELSREDPRVHVLHREDKQGLGRAYVAGFQWALERDYEFIFEMDADFSHNPADIPRFLEAARFGDLVLGSRYVNGIRVINWPLSRLILSKSAAIYVRWITGMPFTDPTGGFKCYRRAVLETLGLDQIRSNGYSFQIEMTHSAWTSGFEIIELPIVFEERRAGHSKMSSAIVREALWMVWKLLFRSGFRRKVRFRHPKSIVQTTPPL